MTYEEALKVVKEYFPQADENLCGYILWNETGWPAFWPTGNIDVDLREHLRLAKAGAPFGLPKGSL